VVKLQQKSKRVTGFEIHEYTGAWSTSQQVTRFRIHEIHGIHRILGSWDSRYRLMASGGANNAQQSTVHHAILDNVIAVKLWEHQSGSWDLRYTGYIGYQVHVTQDIASWHLRDKTMCSS
jgi:hypothetical protein